MPWRRSPIATPMRKNLTGKTFLIVAVLLVFFYGIFGIPKGIGLDAWKDALTNHIHLGLDLKGGIHLVLQVMVQEAVGAVTDNDVARLQTDLHQAGLSAQSVFKPDPAKQPQVIEIQGTPPDRVGDVRRPARFALRQSVHGELGEQQ